MFDFLTKSRAIESQFSPVVPDGKELRPFQRAGIEYLIHSKKSFLADDMGLGKTPQAICAMNTLGIDKYLVVAPASLVENWRREITRWSTSPAAPHIFKTGIKNPVDSILILSFGLVPDVDNLKRILSAYKFDATIVDEAHYLANPTSARTKNLLGINGPFDRDYVFALTGTPLVNKPIDIWPVASRLKPGALGATNYREFCIRYAHERQNPFSGRTEYYGSKNEAELGRLLRSSMMCRREKSAVLKDLPPKTRRAIYLNTDKEIDELVSKETTLYDTFLKDERVVINQASTAFRVRVQLAILKAAQAIEYCKMILATEEKILVFGWHRELLTRVIMGLAKYGPTGITGATSAEKRGQRVDRFQTDPACRVFVGAIPAAGVGLTLTAARHVVMIESSWVPGENVQAEDRAHRIGQRDNVVVDYLVYPNSVDERVLKIVGQKSDQISSVLD